MAYPMRADTMSFFIKTKKKEEKKQAKVGDLFFYATLLLFLMLAGTGLLALPSVLGQGDLTYLPHLFVGLGTGMAVCFFVVRSYFSVFLHELKHMIVALLSGNRAKGMKISHASGHFEYEYSSDTESYNAFISLAPYYVPLATLPMIIALPFLTVAAPVKIFLLGFAYGIDLLLCIRDISPHQTDFSNILGGFYPGVAYVISLHIVFVSVLLVWSVSGFSGLEQFFYNIFSDIAGSKAHADMVGPRLYQP